MNTWLSKEKKGNLSTFYKAFPLIAPFIYLIFSLAPDLIRNPCIENKQINIPDGITDTKFQDLEAKKVKNLTFQSKLRENMFGSLPAIESNALLEINNNRSDFKLFK